MSIFHLHRFLFLDCVARLDTALAAKCHGFINSALKQYVHANVCCVVVWYHSVSAVPHQAMFLELFLCVTTWGIGDSDSCDGKDSQVTMHVLLVKGTPRVAKPVFRGLKRRAALCSKEKVPERRRRKASMERIFVNSDSSCRSGP